MNKISRIASLAFAGALFSWAQTPSDANAPARMVVTVGHYYTHNPPVLRPDDLTVTQRFDPLPITNLIPLRGDRAGLELFVLVDNCSDCEPGSKIDELRRFIGSQPSTTAVGVAYIQNGRLRIVENPTPDHERAIRALNAPAGGQPANPYGPLTDLVTNWRQNSSRRAVLMISNGFDPVATPALQDPFAEVAISAAQRAGVTVYAIYHPSADYLTSDLSKIYSGQVQLAHVADETGGEAYFLGFGPMPSLAPFLTDVAGHLANQYLLEFLANPSEGRGALQEMTIKSKIPDVELMAPFRVWVPARESGPPTGDEQKTDRHRAN